MNRPSNAIALLVASISLSACDAMKKMIDPTGNAYKDTTSKAASVVTTPASASATTPSKSSSPPTSSAPVQANIPPPRPSGGKFEAVIRQKEVGRFLTLAVIEQQIGEITFQARGRSFRFQKGLFHDRTGITSLRDSSGRFWAVAIGDLNMDGNDDAVLLLRTDRTGASPQWDLAYLPNRQGRLYNVQTVELPGDQGFREAVIEGSTVILVPVLDGLSVHVAYSGGELAIVRR